MLKKTTLCNVEKTKINNPKGETKMQKNSYKTKDKINKNGIINNKISGRGGIAFFLRYVEQTGFYELCEKVFGNIRISSKGRYERYEENNIFFIQPNNYQLLR
ncbi:MAG: hypothetical protein AB9882_11015 [Ignavibacteriaceae bacterium]